MKTILNTNDIADALHRDENANWSYQGAKALAEYLEELEEDMGEEMELDVVAIRCDYAQYDSLRDWAEEYFTDKEQIADELGLDLDMSGDEFEQEESEIDKAIRSYIQDNGTLIEFDGGIIVSCF